MPLDSLKSRAVGKVGFLKSVDNLVSVSFSDYEPLAPALAKPAAAATE